MWCPHSWQCGGPERCLMATRDVGPPMFRSAAALRVDGPVGPGRTRSAGDVPIPIPKNPSAAGSGGHVGSRRAQDAPAYGPWGRYSDVRARCPGHRNFRTSELRQRAPARERPQGDSMWAAEQRSFARGRDRAHYPARSNRDRLAHGTRVDRPRWTPHRAELAGGTGETERTPRCPAPKFGAWAGTRVGGVGPVLVRAEPHRYVATMKARALVRGDIPPPTASVAHTSECAYLRQ